MFALILLLISAIACAQSDWVELFDGKSTAGWRGPMSNNVPACWAVEEGALRPVTTPGYFADLLTSRSFRNFELEFEFKAAPGANGGIKYLVQRTGRGRWRGGRITSPPEGPDQPGDVIQEYTSGLEYQILDDAALAEGKVPKRRSASIYSVVPAIGAPDATPNVFHQGRIVVRGDRIEHYLDGIRVLAVTLGSEEMEALWDAALDRRIRNLRGLSTRETPIALTHHGTAVWYRNIRIREWPAPVQ